MGQPVLRLRPSLNAHPNSFLLGFCSSRRELEPIGTYMPLTSSSSMAETPCPKVLLRLSTVLSPAGERRRSTSRQLPKARNGGVACVSFHPSVRQHEDSSQ